MSETLTAGDSGSVGTASGTGGSPTATASPESSSAGTIAQPGASAADSSATPGPIPYERFSEVNTKYNALKWAEAHDPQRVQQQTQFFQWLDADPEGAFRYMEDYLRRQGVLKQQAPAHGQPQGNGRPQPDVVVPETGQRFYSAEQAEKLSEWMAKQAVQPIEQRLQTFEADRHVQAVHAEAARQIAEAETWPHYKAHEAEILAAMQRDGRLSLQGAYNRVVVPKIAQIERQSVLREIQQKSQASTTNPGSVTSSVQRPATAKSSWGDLLKAEMGKRGGKI